METNFFDIVVGVLQGDALAPYLVIFCLDYILWTSIDLIKETGFMLKKQMISIETITNVDYANDLVLLANTPAQAESLLYNLEQAAGGIGLYVNANKTEHMYFKWEGAISTLSGRPLKLIDEFTYLNSNISFTESVVNMYSKTWNTINVIDHVEVWSIW